MTGSTVLPNLLPMVEDDTTGLPIRYPEFGRRLTKALADAELSITDLKNRLGITYEMARRYTLGQAMPRPDRLEQLADVVGISARVLAFGEPIGERVRHHRKQRGMSMAELADEWGKTREIVAGVESGAINVDPGELPRLADILGVSVDHLFRENASTLAAERSANGVESRTRDTVPLISWQDVGINDDRIGKSIVCPVAHGPKTFALHVRGESMSSPNERPSFIDGDIIFVDPDRPSQHRALIVARPPGSVEATFRRLLIDGEQRYLEALNPSWPNRITQIGNETSIYGVVIAKLEMYA